MSMIVEAGRLSTITCDLQRKVPLAISESLDTNVGD